MGKSIVTLVTQKLTEAGFWAAEACPGQKLPKLTDIAVAVELKNVNLREKTAQLNVSVFAPVSMGAQACQKAALSVGQVLLSDGADCTQGSCSFDGLANLFCIKIAAKYSGTVLAEDWTDMAGFSVTLGAAQLGSLVSFTASRKTDDTVTALSDAPWTFELEEFFRPEDPESADPTEPFTLVVQRPLQRETFTECVWTSQERFTEQSGTWQVRKGKAGGRSIVSLA